MKITQVAAILYAIISFGIVVFQLALAAGAPWGAYAMGGAFPGQFPPALLMLISSATVAFSRAPGSYV